MRPPGTSEQLAKRRQKALDLLESGKALKDIARQLGTTERSVRRWREEAKHPKKKNKRGPGKEAYLSKQQIKKLERELLKGAYAHDGGYRLGLSCQGAPVRMTHRMPFKMARLSTRGLPFPSARFTGLGNKGSTTAHCSSVRSIGSLPV